MTEPAPSELSRLIVEGTPDAILYADRDGRIRLWNAGAERIFGFTAAEAVGQSLDLIVPERLRGRHWDGWDKTMASGLTRYGAGDLLAVPALHKDGRQLSIEFSIQLLKAPDGSVTGSAAILRDVTARFERDKALKLKVKELEAKVGKAG
ncbi:MAG: PAS domain S-box protein [Deltaproteobacteria bacterium]|nr:PAS domain S-box protein [Deltaproteobacteria bacterium]